MKRNDILNRYRQVRAISSHHQSAALACLPRMAILEHAKQLGLASGKTLFVEAEQEMTLVFDMAVHTAKPGRSRAIDRHAKAAALPDASEAGRVLTAIREARFSVWAVERHHDVAGVIVTDLIRNAETWLLDEGLEMSAKPGFVFASRLCWPAEFAMTCGSVVPVDAELLTEVLANGGRWLHRGEPACHADNPRFAASVYRAALAAGVMETVGSNDVLAAE